MKDRYKVVLGVGGAFVLYQLGNAFGPNAESLATLKKDHAVLRAAVSDYIDEQAQINAHNVANFGVFARQSYGGTEVLPDDSKLHLIFGKQGSMPILSWSYANNHSYNNLLELAEVLDEESASARMIVGPESLFAGVSPKPINHREYNHERNLRVLASWAQQDTNNVKSDFVQIEGERTQFTFFAEPGYSPLIESSNATANFSSDDRNVYFYLKGAKVDSARDGDGEIEVGERAQIELEELLRFSAPQVTTHWTFDNPSGSGE